MPTFYKIDKQRRLVMTTYSGVITLADALTYQAKLLQDPDFDPSFSQLFDITHMTEAQINSEDVRTLAQTSVFSPHSRRAILVSNDVQFGLSRMFETFRETFGEHGIRVFRNLDDALDWVLSDNRDNPR